MEEEAGEAVMEEMEEEENEKQGGETRRCINYKRRQTTKPR